MKSLCPWQVVQKSNCHVRESYLVLSSPRSTAPGPARSFLEDPSHMISALTPDAISLWGQWKCNVNVSICSRMRKVGSGEQILISIAAENQKEFSWNEWSPPSDSLIPQRSKSALPSYFKLHSNQYANCVFTFAFSAPNSHSWSRQPKPWFSVPGAVPSHSCHCSVVWQPGAGEGGGRRECKCAALGKLGSGRLVCLLLLFLLA